MRGVAHLQRHALASGCTLVGARRHRGRLVGVWDCPDASDGQPMATARLLEGLTREDRSVRALPRVRGTPAQIHAYVKRRVRFVFEPVETFQSPAATLALGYGDCDDSARAIVALCEASGYPGRLVYFLQDGQPAHVVAQVYDGGAWRWAEATVDARYGEHPFAACDRLGIKRDDMSGTPHLLSAHASPGAASSGTMGGMGSTTPLATIPSYVGADFPAQLAALSAGIGADPLDVLKLLLAESALQPYAKNTVGFTGGDYAIGINQLAGSPPNKGSWRFFAPLSAAQYAALTAAEQLPYAFAYWQDAMKRHGLTSVSGRDLYWLNFLPATYKANAPDSTVLCGANGPLSWAFGPNKGLSSDGSTITAGDMQKALDRQMSNRNGPLYQALAPLVATVPGTPAVPDLLVIALCLGIGAALAYAPETKAILRAFGV